MAREQLKEAIRDEARRLGFARCGFTTTDPLPHEAQLGHWVSSGMAASMNYMSNTWRQRAHPRQLLAEARTAIVVALAVRNERQPAAAPCEGRVARYARGRDYHHVIRERLDTLRRWIEQRCPDESMSARAVVDTAPLLERELGMRAGLGFIGKNTLLITPGIGSHTLLGTLLISFDLPPDAPQTARCGQCDLCLRACPTSAFADAYRLDARRCIAYLTIESREPVPIALRPKLDGWLFGCDSCQEVCPFNASTHHGPVAIADPEVAPDDGRSGLALVQLLNLRSGDYRRMVRGRPFARVSRPLWQRNAAAVAATRALSSDVDQALFRASNSTNEAVSETARWALTQRQAKSGRLI